MTTSAPPVEPSCFPAVGLTSIEICAGAGGQALGLEAAGFDHLALVELDPWAAETLRKNRPSWNVIGPVPGDRSQDERLGDIRHFDASPYRGVDLLAGGVPCPPFSVAGKQLGEDDERDLFWRALELVEQCAPRAVMLENVRGIMDAKFAGYRARIVARLNELGYDCEEERDWRIVEAADFGVPQLRPRAILVALRNDAPEPFSFPVGDRSATPTVGESLKALMKANGWRGVDAWVGKADRIAPTLVGGSKKHGGPDLGPTRAKRAWRELGVNAHVLAAEAPGPSFTDDPCLTVEMAAVLQGFPPATMWRIEGRKTHAYRQVGNAFPPPVAEAIGRQIAAALLSDGPPEASEREQYLEFAA